MAAAGSLAVAIYAGSTEAGTDRLRIAAINLQEMVQPPSLRPARPLGAEEGRRLAESVRMLTADRERLLARITTLEQSMDGITGSIARVERAARTASPPSEAATVPTEPPSASAPEDLTSSVPPPRSEPGTSQAPSSSSSTVTKTEFGLDLGGAPSVEALRTAWAAALRRHGALLEGLRPIVHARDRGRGAVDFRLVAGPIANAAHAARLCASMNVAGGICQPALYNGQRLAVR